MFTKIGETGTEARPAKLKADMFWTGKAAHDSSDRIIYDKATGALYYDADGTGRSAQVKIATLTKNQKVSVSDFFASKPSRDPNKNPAILSPGFSCVGADVVSRPQPSQPGIRSRPICSS